MKRSRISLRLLGPLALLVAANICSAAYQPVVILKFPFASEYQDSLGNTITDSLVREKPFVATLYRTGMTDSTAFEGLTDDSGACGIHFAEWARSRSSVEASNAGRIDISFPRTWRATRAGGRFVFEPLRIEGVSFAGRTGETLVVVMPLSVTCESLSIGNGPFGYDFVVLADCHVGEGSKCIGLMEDFGTELWDDTELSPTETTDYVANVEACRDFINEELDDQHGYDVRFVALTGDITATSERSEYQRARRILAEIDSKLFIVPLLGNHDAWPYVGNAPWPFFNEQSEEAVVIGEFFTQAFRGVYDSLRSLLPLPNWQESPYLLTATDSSCEDWPSYYNDFAFNYQGSKFIAADFVTREHAVTGWPGVRSTRHVLGPGISLDHGLAWRAD